MRPKLPPSQKRVIRHGVAFSASEYDRLCRVALALRMSVNDFVRLMSVPSPQQAEHGCKVEHG